MSFIEHMDKKLYSYTNCNYLKIVLVKYNRKLNNLQTAILHVYDSSSNFKFGLKFGMIVNNDLPCVDN